jgi:hypothetical protein
MRKVLAMLLSLFAAGAILLAPTAASASPRHVKHACIKVFAGFSSRHVHAGDDLSVSGDWDGCGQSVYFRYVFRLTGPCDAAYRDEGHGRIAKGDGYGIFAILRACEGTYRVTAKAYHDGVLVGRDSQYVHVRP